MTLELKRLDVWSCMKVAFILFAILGLLIGIFYAMIIGFVGSIIGPLAGTEIEPLRGLFSGGLGIFLAVFMAIFYAVMGTIATAITVWLYNVCARWVGGIKVNLEGEKAFAFETPEEKPPSLKYE
jgi:MFS family permease